ncbi:hypothetical protein A0J61_07437 [Choanephora cucurbitarum]|uniref:Uncharacterized protein n=1 Tax=Choanephora cucurbitarum TaxID=101091 RepID=A0A1C7N662_9FUNG|nr:hypothetical protein A0J61_07437 [Choanephora cucurbitarum]
MPVGVFSIFGVICALLGLSSFLISMIALFPINIFNSVKSCIVLAKTMSGLEDEPIPSIFFACSITISALSILFFYKIVHKGMNSGKTEQSHTNYGSTQNGTNKNDDNQFLVKHRQHMFNAYTFGFIFLNVFWAALAYLLLTRVQPEEIQPVVYRAMQSQFFAVFYDLIVLMAAGITMGLASVFFITGRKLRNKPNHTNYFSIV